MTIASYLPQVMMIKLKSDLNVLNNFNYIEGFKTRQEIGVFFHEWIHYVHNTTTLLGLSSFYSSISLWHLFRNTYNNKVFAGGEFLSNKDQEYLSEIITYLEKMYSSDSFDNRGLLNRENFESLEILEIELKQIAIVQENEIYALQCKLRKHGYDSEYIISVNTNEIIENVAALLEYRLVEKLNGSPQHPSQIVPYRIIELIAQQYKLNTEQLICCMLATLQTSNPPSVLLHTFEIAKQAIDDNKSPIKVLNEFVLSQIKENKNFISNVQSFIIESFPLEDEFIGNALKSVFNKIEQNIIVHRCENPFFELSIIEQICLNESCFNDAIRKYGGCHILKERTGDIDEIQRDLMYEIIDSPHSTDWQIFHAAYFFVKSHINKGKSFSSQREIKNYKCPFYTSCGSELRKKESLICKETPWVSESWSGWGTVKNMCWYATAVRQTRPPENWVNLNK